MNKKLKEGIKIIIAYFLPLGLIYELMWELNLPIISIIAGLYWLYYCLIIHQEREYKDKYETLKASYEALFAEKEELENKVWDLKFKIYDSQAESEHCDKTDEMVEGEAW